ncbi:MAG: PTS sugar transporter subunit IIA [Phycisphaerales bacterium]|nr:PTS sugar transporter subunit IIA [Phycisphaerales bacterium]
MPYGNMSIEELARHIGMDARLVRKWAEKGKLPGQLVGGQWRFNRAALLEWLQQHMHSLEEEHVRNLERAMRASPGDALVAAYLPTEAVEMNLAARSQNSVLRELVNLAARTGLVYDEPGLLEALVQRESLGSTALPRGIAFPHPRRPLPFATAEPLLALARVPAGIPFGAPDGRLTDIFVLVCAQTDNLHLGLLARLSMMFSRGVADDLRDVSDATEAVALMIRTEAALLATK